MCIHFFYCPIRKNVKCSLVGYKIVFKSVILCREKYGRRQPSHHGNYTRMKIGNSVPFLIIHTKFRGFPGVCARAEFT